MNDAANLNLTSLITHTEVTWCLQLVSSSLISRTRLFLGNSGDPDGISTQEDLLFQLSRTSQNMNSFHIFKQSPLRQFSLCEHFLHISIYCKNIRQNNLWRARLFWNEKYEAQRDVNMRNDDWDDVSATHKHILK